MKKLLYLFLLLPLSGMSQNQYSFGFEGTTAAMISSGWQVTNQSSPVYTGAPTWSIPASAPTTTFAGGAQAGTATSFSLINYTSTGTSSSAGSGTISNWLISPIVNVQNGDVVTFYTRLGRNVAAGGSASFADNLELRMSTNGAFTTNPSGGAAGLGDFTNLLVEVNPSLDLTSYPITWTQYSYTVAGLTGPSDVKFAFRYFVTDGGANGNNSDIIGIDSFSVARPTAANQDFFSSNFSLSPNPVKDIFTVNAKNNIAVQNIKVVDINGRIVNELNNINSSDAMQVNIGELNAGVYFVKVQTELGVGTSKIIKK